MTKKKLEELKKMLLQKREEILRNLAVSENSGKETDYDSTQDQADKALSAYTKEFFYSLTDTERETLNLIEEALQRIEKGKYGYCRLCGSEIGEKRLTSIPWAKYCKECQEKVEKEKALKSF